MKIISVEHSNVIRIDLENGRYANIITHFNYVRFTVNISIEEIGILTGQVFNKALYKAFDGEYGLSIKSYNSKETKETYDLYEKYKEVIDPLVIKNDLQETIEGR